MPLSSLRKYITSQTELEEYLGEPLSVYDSDLLIRAEIDIDNIIGQYFEGAYRRFLFHTTGAFDATLTSTTATISNLDSTNDGYYDRVVMTVLSGSNKSKTILVDTHVGSVLTFFDTQSGLSGTAKVRLSQIAKFPMMGDSEQDEGIFYKIIPDFLKRCVSLQYQYRSNNASTIDDTHITNTYSVSKDAYSEGYDSKGRKSNIDRVSPQAVDILKDKGLLI